MSKTTNKYSPEVRERAVRLVLDNQGQHSSGWQAIMSISAKIGCSAHTLNECGKKAEVDSGQRAGVPTGVTDKMKALEPENRELRQANEIFRKASAFLRWRNSAAGRSDGVMPSTRIAWSMGSSRSALSCRLPLPRIMSTWRSGLIRPGCRTVPGVMRYCGPRSGGF